MMPDAGMQSLLKRLLHRAPQVIDRIQVGPRPVHMFAVPETLEVWTHSDAAGTFDVISIDDTDSLNATVAVSCAKPQAPATLNPDPCCHPDPNPNMIRSRRDRVSTQVSLTIGVEHQLGSMPCDVTSRLWPQWGHGCCGAQPASMVSCMQHASVCQMQCARHCVTGLRPKVRPRQAAGRREHLPFGVRSANVNEQVLEVRRRV